MRDRQTTYPRDASLPGQDDPPVVQEALLELAPEPDPALDLAGPPPRARRHQRGGAACRARSPLADELKPRTRLLAAGHEALSGAELLAVLFPGGGDARSSLEAAETIVSESGGLLGLSRCSYEDLRAMPGVGEAKACSVLAAVELGKRLAEARGPDRPTISGPSDVDALLRPRLAGLDREHFVCVLLDTKNRVLDTPTISVGTLSASLVHPREVFKAAIKASAANVIFAHNHPSGHTEPSTEDRTLTKRLADAGELLGIQVLDHLIIGDRYLSMKERGIL